MKPQWLKLKLDTGRQFPKTASVLRELDLTTVCTGAQCPNKSKCWGNGTATFMIMGSTCTRNCRFCSVKKGKGEEIDGSEPGRLAEAVERLSLKYTIITSVDRDDLPDRGADHFSKCVDAVRKAGSKVEVLIPDYRDSALEKVIASKPDVIGHNLEIVRSLTPGIRDKRAGYEKSLGVLDEVKRKNKNMLTKSSLMLGLGETNEEVIDAMKDLRYAGVDMLTLGQYLRPSTGQVEVSRFVHPSEFFMLGKIAEEMGFVCFSGPFVRSSFRASEMFESMRG